MSLGLDPEVPVQLNSPATPTQCVPCTYLQDQVVEVEDWECPLFTAVVDCVLASPSQQPGAHKGVNHHQQQALWALAEVMAQHWQQYQPALQACCRLAAHSTALGYGVAMRDGDGEEQEEGEVLEIPSSLAGVLRGRAWLPAVGGAARRPVDLMLWSNE